jgi:hypothetical protein
MLSDAEFLGLTFALCVSPLAVWGTGIAVATRIGRFRWLVHVIAIVAMPFLGPLLFVWTIMPRDGSELNPGVGMALLPFIGMLAISFFGYIASAISLWRSSNKPKIIR